MLWRVSHAWRAAQWPRVPAEGSPPCAPPQPRGGRWCWRSPARAVPGELRITAVPICLGGTSSLRAPATMALLLLLRPARAGPVTFAGFSRHSTIRSGNAAVLVNREPRIFKLHVLRHQRHRKGAQLSPVPFILMGFVTI